MLMTRGRCLRVFKGHTENVRAVTWSADQRRAISGSNDNTVRLWDVTSGKMTAILHPAPANQRLVTLAFSPDLTLEAYLQPFVAVGDYTDIRKLARPASFAFDPMVLISRFISCARKSTGTLRGRASSSKRSLSATALE